MKRWLLRAALAVGLAWVLTVAGASFVYIQRLLHPGCSAAAAEQPGYLSVTISSGSLRLAGWWRAPLNGAVVLLMGGHGAGRDAMLAEANVLAQRGFGILAVEQRSCAGELATLGYREAEDFGAMADFALRQPGVKRLGALGFSAGGAAALLAAARDPRLAAVAAEGNYANLYDEMTASAAPLLSLEWQIDRFCALFYTLGTGVWAGDVSPVDAAAEIAPRAVLLIHGAGEIERSQGQRQFAAAGTPKQLWIVPGAGHGEYLAAAPEEYPRRLAEFFEMYLLI